MGVSAFLVVGTIGLAATTFAKKALQKTIGYDEPYTITINAEDVTTNTTAHDGSYVAHTDQLGNPVTFNYEKLKFEQVGEDKYLVFGADSWFANDKDWQIRSVETVTVYGDDAAFSYDYGWELNAGAIVYTEEDHYDWANGTDFYCNSDKPNYVKLMYRSSEVKISKIVFAFSKDCASGSNPYVVVNGIKYRKHSTYAQAIGFAGASFKDVTIEDTVSGLPVTSIDHHAFYYDTTIETITLGSNVTLINNNAFQYANHLKTVNGIENVTTFFDCAFEECYSLTGDVTFNDEISYIGNSAFRLTDITSITFSETCNPYIAISAFRDMSELRSIHYGQAMEYYDDLLYCDNLETITVSAGNATLSAVDNVLYCGKYVERIAQKRPQTTFTLPAGKELLGYCGYGATTLETLVLNDDESRIPDYCFNNCTSLTSITFGNHSNFTINYGFRNCDSLETLIIPSNVSTIYQRAFENCDNLKTVIFEDGCARLDNEVFRNCTKLEKVLLPTTLTDVGNGTSWTGAGVSSDVFAGCTKLNKVLTRLEEGSDYSGDFADGWMGTRTLVKHSDTIKDGSHWRMHPTYGPQAWKTTVTFKTNYVTTSGQGMFMAGTFNEWAQSTSYRMTYEDGIWSIDIELDTCTDTPYEFKCFRADYDNPASNQHWEIENHSYTFKDVETEYWCTNF